VRGIHDGHENLTSRASNDVRSLDVGRLLPLVGHDAASMMAVRPELVTDIASLIEINSQPMAN
jgi:hypothetical protein